MTWLSAVHELLQAVGRPARFGDVAIYLAVTGSVATTSSKPEKSLRDAVARDIRNRYEGGEAQRFFSLGGTVGLVEFDQAAYRPPTRERFDEFVGRGAAGLRTRPQRQNPEKPPPPNTGTLAPPHPPGGETGPEPDAPGHASQSSRWVGVRIWYATDRQRTAILSIDARYGQGRGALEYGSLTVSIPDTHRVGEMERPRWWDLGKQDRKRHVVLLGGEAMTGDTMVAQLRTIFAAGAPEILLFVHGFNVSFAEAARRTAQIAYDLRYRGVPMLFSWPSNAETIDYVVDEANVEWSEPHLRSTFARIAEAEPERIHVLSHSMGGRLVGEVVERGAEAGTAWSRRLHQLIYAAPDIDADVFLQWVPGFSAERTTLYASANDRAMELSKRIHGYPRAGDADDLLITDGVDTIDASNADTSFVGHSYYSEWTLLNDVYQMVRYAHPPSQRFGLVAKERSGRPYWLFAPT